MTLQESKLMNPGLQDIQICTSGGRIWNCKLLLCSVICYLCPLLPILIYSVTCHTWRQRYTDQAPANTLSICYFLHWHSYLDVVEQRGKAMYILGVLKYSVIFAELMEVSLLKGISIRNRGTSHPKRETSGKQACLRVSGEEHYCLSPESVSWPRPLILTCELYRKGW